MKKTWKANALNMVKLELRTRRSLKIIILNEKLMCSKFKTLCKTQGNNIGEGDRNMLHWI